MYILITMSFILFLYWSSYLVHKTNGLPAATIPKLILHLEDPCEVEEARLAVSDLYKSSGLSTVDPEIIQVGDFVSMIVPAGDKILSQELNKLASIRIVEQEKKWSFASLPIGIARAGQRQSYQVTNFYIDTNAGYGVEIWVLDSGCNPRHPELLGRSYVVSAMSPGNFPASRDVQGHGTHVAATAAGDTFGIARGANVVCVQIMNSQLTYTGGALLRGLSLVSNALIQNPEKKIVVNLSISGPGGGSSASNLAVDSLVRMGAGVVVAAGNNAQDACNYSPAAASLAITVGAMDALTDEIAGVSNTGKCVDIFAPGVNVLSADRNGGSRIMSGTSMATPHVSGALAVLMAQNMDNLAAMRALIQMATKNTLTGNFKGAPNLMLFFDSYNMTPAALPVTV